VALEALTNLGPAEQLPLAANEFYFSIKPGSNLLNVVNQVWTVTSYFSSYSVGPGFKSRPRRLAFLRVFVVFLSSHRRMPG
jgi:hypothetical protein